MVCGILRGTMPKQNRLSFNCLVEPATKKIVVAARKRLGISQGGVIDVWAQFDKAAGAIGTPEIKKAAAVLRKLMKEARDISTKRKK